MGIGQTTKRKIATQMAKDYQSHQTQPGQFIHLRMTWDCNQNIQDDGQSNRPPNRDILLNIQGQKKKGLEDAEYIEERK